MPGFPLWGSERDRLHDLRFDHVYPRQAIYKRLGRLFEDREGAVMAWDHRLEVEILFGG